MYVSKDRIWLLGTPGVKSWKNLFGKQSVDYRINTCAAQVAIFYTFAAACLATWLITIHAGNYNAAKWVFFAIGYAIGMQCIDPFLLICATIESYGRLVDLMKHSFCLRQRISLRPSGFLFFPIRAVSVMFTHNRSNLAQLLLIGFGILAIPSAWGDAAILSVSGNPRPMKKEHSTVELASETVDVYVGKYLVDVDCKFNFKNNGPKCTVKVGFPDFPSQFNEPVAEGSVSFKSFVNGVEVPTTVEKGELEHELAFWHTQNIEFPANSDLSLREIYTVPSGGGAISENEFSRIFMYVLQTGHTWQGKIQRATIKVTFDKSVIAGNLKAKQNAQFNSEKDRLGSNTVLYKTSVRPLVDKHTMVFEYTDIEPAEPDNLCLHFQPMSLKNSLVYFKGLLSVLNESGKISNSELLRLTMEVEEEFKEAQQEAKSADKAQNKK